MLLIRNEHMKQFWGHCIHHFLSVQPMNFEFHLDLDRIIRIVLKMLIKIKGFYYLIIWCYHKACYLDVTMDFVMSSSLAYLLHNGTIKVTIAPNFISHNKKMTLKNQFWSKLLIKRKCWEFYHVLCYAW